MGSNAVAPLVHLRQLMSEYDGGALQAFLVPSEDAHQVNNAQCAESIFKTLPDQAFKIIGVA